MPAIKILLSLTSKMDEKQQRWQKFWYEYDTRVPGPYCLLPFTYLVVFIISVFVSHELGIGLG